MRYLETFAGWGPCGAFNTEGVYDFFGIAVAALLLGGLLSLGLALGARKLFRFRRGITAILAFVTSMVSVVLIILVTSAAAGESIRSFTKRDFFCEPINGIQQFIFIGSLFALLGVSLLVFRILASIRK